MKITVEIPDEVAVKMLSGAISQELALLELAIFTAISAGRISEREGAALLGSEDRFFVHEVMKRRGLEIEQEERQYLEQELAGLRLASDRQTRSAAPTSTLMLL